MPFDQLADRDQSQSVKRNKDTSDAMSLKNRLIEFSSAGVLLAWLPAWACPSSLFRSWIENSICLYVSASPWATGAKSSRQV